jgi:hypothetical protein
VSLEVKRKNLARQLDELAGHGVTAYTVFDATRPEPEVKPLRSGGRGGGSMVDLDKDRS